MTLKEIRFIRNLTQQSLSTKSGISQSSLSNIERGFVKPTAMQKKRIAKALQLNPKVITWGQ